MMKRWLALFALCMIIVMAMAVPVYATDGDGSGTPCTHTYGSWTVAGGTHTRTCTACGATDSGAHSWSSSETPATCSNKGSVVKTCSVCGSRETSEIPATGAHTYGSYTKEDDVNHKRVCSGCNQASVTPHSWDGGKYTAEATCKDEGRITYTCTVCASTKTSAVAKLTNHTYDNACDTDCNVCGTTRSGGHQPSGVWSTRSSSHYRVCLVCAKELESVPHHAGPAATEKKAQTCTVCGYVMTPIKSHTHKITQEIQMDEGGHWKICDTCGEKVEQETHAYDDGCDESCNTCGFVNTYAHTFGETFHSDELSHWVECTACSKVGNKQLHMSGDDTGTGEAQLCLICGAEMTAAQNHTHEAGSDWFSNDSSHWHECACGEQMEKAAHAWDAGTENPDGSVTHLCTACGAETTQAPAAETEPETEAEQAEGGFPLWILGVVALVAAGCGAAVAVLIMAGKNRSGKFSK